MTKREIAMVDLPAAYNSQKDELDAAAARVLASGWYILGEENAAFERDFAAWCGISHAVGVANGTDALIVALRGLGLGAGDTVFTVSHTAVATVAAITLAGATAMLVDIDPAHFTLDPKTLEGAIAACRADGGRPKAVIAVHLYGQPCDLTAIQAICRTEGMFLIEDCAQAHGATLNGQRVGTIGDVACFSFYPTKNLGAFGDGGAVVTNNAILAARCAAIRQYGWKERYSSDIEGMNSRLDEIQAAMLAVRLKRLDDEIAVRRRIARQYDFGLAAAIATPAVRANADHAYHLYVVRSPKRDALAAALKEHHIGTGIHYPVPVHLQNAYRGRLKIAPSGLLETERASTEVLSLPMHPFLKEEDVIRVIERVRAFV